MTKLKCIALFLAALCSASAMADENVRDGRPCLGGVCVGDEISTLAGIKWEPALYDHKPIASFKFSDSSIKSLLINFAPSAATAVAAAAPYVQFNVFDSKGIPKLAKIKGFCGPRLFTGLEGTFISDSGHTTRVFINYVPGVDPSSQSLLVERIDRVFMSSEYTSEQMSELSRQLEERYRGVKKGASQTEPTWSFEGNAFGKNPILSLMAPHGDAGQISNQLKKYPGCGKPLKID